MASRLASWLGALVDPEVSRAVDDAPNRVNELGFDPWGFSPRFAKIGYSLGKRTLVPWFRPEVEGIENVPEGRVLLVPNHSGQLPWDGVVVALTMVLHGKPPRVVRAMVERAFPSMPFANEVLARGGAVLGDPVNCRNLLEDEQAILVFPEGARGGGKVWKHRYQLQRFGRGFMRLALQTRTPIVPIAILGGEESIPSLHDAKRLARLLGMPYFPVPPHLPLVGPLAYAPLPVKFHLRFGEAMRFEGRADEEDTVIDEKVEAVRAVVQRMIDDGLARRRGVFF